MTSERKMEVNRRLRMFENPQMMDMSDAQGRPAFPDYTADLNALVRLEAKLPPHIWHLWDGMAEFVPDSLYIQETVGTGSEAEARAQAIFRYLEAQDAKSATAKL